MTEMRIYLYMKNDALGVGTLCETSCLISEFVSINLNTG